MLLREITKKQVTRRGRARWAAALWRRPAASSWPALQPPAWQKIGTVNGVFLKNIGDPKHIPLDRERLLVELLALNFGEHFELKPLMLQIDKKLAVAEAAATSRATREQLGQERRSLRSNARRVSSRQIAMLLNQGTVNDKTRIVPLAFIEWGGEQDQGLNTSQEQNWNPISGPCPLILSGSQKFILRRGSAPSIMPTSEKSSKSIQTDS